MPPPGFLEHGRFGSVRRLPPVEHDHATGHGQLPCRHAKTTHHRVHRFTERQNLESPLLLNVPGQHAANQLAARHDQGRIRRRYPGFEQAAQQGSALLATQGSGVSRIHTDLNVSFISG